MTPKKKENNIPNKARSARGSRRGSPSHKYALLIKPTAKFISREVDLENIKTKLLQLQKILSISEVNFEKGQHRNHIHAIVTHSRKSLYAKKYQSKGFYVGLQPIRNESAYRTYINKEQEIMAIEDFYTSKFGFVDSRSSDDLENGISMLQGNPTFKEKAPRRGREQPKVV